MWELHVHDFRDATTDAHRSVDDTPFGGGAGMVLRAEPIIETVESTPDLARPVIALTPSGRVFTHDVARELSELAGFTLLCGRYEGFDQRALDLVVDEELSLGDFVLAGGELAALCVIESVVRLLPGALGNDESSADESFSDGLLEYPQYTKPAEVRGLRRARDPALGRPRAHRAVAPGPGAASEPWRDDRDLIERRGGLSDDGRALARRISRRWRSLDGNG